MPSPKRWLALTLSMLLTLSISACTTESPPAVQPQPTPIPATAAPPEATVSALPTSTPSVTPTAAASSTTTTLITDTIALAPLQPLQRKEIVDRPLRNVRALTDGTVKYKTALWSPGAEWIAAVPQDGPGMDAIDTRSGEVRPIVTDTFVLEPLWADADTLLVHQTAPDGDQLTRFILAEEAVRQEPLITNAPSIRAVGAGGSSITFATAQGQLQILQQSMVQHHSLPLAALVTAPAPEPQDSPIIAVNPLVANLEAVQTVLLRIDGDRATSTPLSNAGEGLWLPRWSPDGAKLALTSIEGRIVSSSSDGARRFDLGPGDQPSWSPDGTRLAYAGTSAGLEFISRDIHVTDWRGAEPRARLTEANEEQFFTSPSWSPDGTRIAFVEIDDGKIYVGDVP
ncbi:MAG TPA: hypothetical protein VFZ66_19845 [Herpetosiphonaceae bacterium]